MNDLPPIAQATRYVREMVPALVAQQAPISTSQKKLTTHTRRGFFNYLEDHRLVVKAIQDEVQSTRLGRILGLKSVTSNSIFVQDLVVPSEQKNYFDRPDGIYVGSGRPGREHAEWSYDLMTEDQAVFLNGVMSLIIEKSLNGQL